MGSDWSDKAAEAAQSVRWHYLCHSRSLPLLYYPANMWLRQRNTIWFRHMRTVFPLEHYWWCAQFIDCVIDQAIRSGKREDRSLVRRLIWTLFVRNYGTIVNDYYDDMAWLGLAIQRAERNLHLRFPRFLQIIQTQLNRAWTPEYGGGMRWWKKDYYFNAPTNGAAGIFILGCRDFSRAKQISQWINSQLYDSGTGLILDGIHSRVHSDGSYTLQDRESTLYTYNQGTVAALEWNLCQQGMEQVQEFDRLERVTRIIAGVAREMCTTDMVIRGQGEGDAGLFPGILARYLAEIVCTAHTVHSINREVEITSIVESSQTIVLNSAAALYQGALREEGGLRFSADWSQPVGSAPSDDLSVQLGAWMTLEAAARIERYLARLT